MKLLSNYLVFLIAIFALQANAATFDLGKIDLASDLESDFTGTGPFSDTWNFQVPKNGGVKVSVTNSTSTSITDIIGDFSATLDGVVMPSTVNGNLVFFLKNLPASGDASHTIVITGSSIGSYGGSIVVTPPSQVPVPAAFWLLGSGLIGLVFKSKKAS